MKILPARRCIRFKHAFFILSLFLLLMGICGNSAAMPPVVVTITTANPVICSGSAAVINASAPGAVSFAWTPATGLNATNTSTVNASPSATTTYTVTAIDSSGSADTASVTITVNSLPGLSASSTDTYCNHPTGMCNMNASGGGGNYSYQWNSVPVQTNATATGLGAGTYTCTVTDGNGCTASASAQVNYFNAGTASIAAISHVTCFGADDGTAMTGMSGGAPPYTYSWNCLPQQNTQTASGLGPGSYIVTVTDAAGCSSSASAVITEPAQLSEVVAVTNTSCFAVNGEVNITVSGGTPPYSYQWSTVPVQYGNTATGLSTGYYSCMVTDANGCTLNPLAQVFSVNGAYVTVTSVVPVYCHGGRTGSVSVQPSGGTPPYLYAWNTNPVQTTASAVALEAGSYIVTVTDGGGCTSTAGAVVYEPDLLLTTGTSTNNYCGSVTALANVTASGGTPPYYYNWSTVPAQTTHLATGLASGSYTCNVTDAAGCTVSRLFIIDEINSGTAVTSVTQTISCPGDSNGIVAVTMNGGSPPFSYSWNTIPAQSNSSATLLSMGTYQVVITDGNGCTVTATVNLDAPDPFVTSLVTSMEHCSAKDGHAQVQVSGGNPPYTYRWSTFPAQLTETATGLRRGNYSCLVNDASNCFFIKSVDVDGTVKPTAAFMYTPGVVSIQNPLCSFIDQSIHANEWHWTFEDALNPSSSDFRNPAFAFSDTGHWCVKLVVKNADECMDSVEHCVDVNPGFSVFVPSAFTPNNDGINDLFFPQMFGAIYKDYSFEVYDRWGMLVFRTSAVNGSWDGKINNRHPLRDVYVWKIMVREESGEMHKLDGKVTLAR
jgi:gliding motility-associated-like protein